MELILTQKILARLYTDAALREQFLADPRSVQEEFGLTGAELHSLTRLPQAQLEYFAASLVRKRAREVSKLLPVTARAMGGAFEPAFHSFAERFRPAGIKKHCDDAVTFAVFLRKWAREGALAPRWLGDLASYEAANLEATHSTRRFTATFLQYAVAETVALAARWNYLPSVEARQAIAVWFRLSRWSGVWHFTLPLPTRAEQLTVLRLNDRPSGGAASTGL